MQIYAHCTNGTSFLHFWHSIIPKSGYNNRAHQLSCADWPCHHYSLLLCHTLSLRGSLYRGRHPPSSPDSTSRRWCPVFCFSSRSFFPVTNLYPGVPLFRSLPWSWQSHHSETDLYPVNLTFLKPVLYSYCQPLSDQSCALIRSYSSIVIGRIVPCLKPYGKENSASDRSKCPSARQSARNGT